VQDSAVVAREAAAVKVGCTVWAFAKQHYAAPYEEAIDTVAGLGFGAIDMMLFSHEDLDEYWKPDRIPEIRRRIERSGLELTQVHVFDHLVNSLPSLDAGRRRRAIDTFERCCSVARALGSPQIQMVSQWVEGLEGPTAYPPHVTYVEVRNASTFNPKLHLALPKPLSWSAIWEQYIDTLSTCNDIARQHGLRLALEGHANVVVSGTDAMLRVLDRIPDPNFGINFDTAWHLVQREYVPLSVLKLGSRIIGVHARDGDGLASYSLPPGQGIIDWDEVIRALVEVGYEGSITIEFGRYKEPERWLTYARQFLESVIAANS
jgi:sugar phosphate isomerase/epimerase